MIEKLNRPLPDYSPTMYEDYKPWEVLAAAHKKILATAPQPTDDYNIHITSEVRIKK